MGFMDKVKGLVKGKGDQIDGGIDKVAGLVDDKTSGKYSEKIDSAAEKAKEVVDKVDGDDTK